VKVHSPKTYIFDSTGGELAGTMKLAKAGAGRLTLTGTNTYSGPTLVGEGLLLVNGSLPNSPMTVRGGVWLDGRLGGSGVIGSTVRFEEGAGFSPGPIGNDSPGTLNIANTVTLAGRTRSNFDLSDDPAAIAKTNDLVQINGNLDIIGTNTFVFSLLNGTVPPGSVYPLVNYTGTLTGNINGLRAEGLDGYPYAFTNPPGQIALVIKTPRAPAILTWTGGLNGNAWDLASSSNFLNGLSKDSFYPNDTVRFNSVGSSNLMVSLSGALLPSNVIVDSSANYTLTGEGAIIGAGSLLKSNSGTLTLSGINHKFTGRTVVAGGTLAVAELDGAGYPSSIGGANANPTNLLLTGGSTLRVLGECYTDRGITISGGTNSIEVSNGADQFTMLAPLTGLSAFQKLGAGTLAFSAGNSFSGTTIIKAGSISLGGDPANTGGFGTGTPTIILDGGGITMFIDNNTTQTSTWNLVVPTNSTGFLNLDWRCVLAGSGSGGGTLAMWTPYVRADISGNWSAFTGQLNVTTDWNASDVADRGGDFRIANAAGFPNAKMNLQRLVSLQNRVSAGATINIGELSGEPGCNVAAPGGNSGLAATFSVGALNTSAIFGGNTYNGLSFTKVGAGTWTWTGTNIAHTGTTTVNGGTLLINGNAVRANGAVIVGGAGTLAGNGTLGGAVTVNGKISPGTTIGILTGTNTVTLANSSSTVIEINKTPKTNDLLRSLRTLTYGGVLTVTNLSGPLAPGDSFKIFDATSYAGSFAAFNLPSLPKGLAWYKPALLTSGTLTVVTNPPPRITNTWFAGGSLTFKGTGGGPLLDYQLLSATNVALPLTQWTRMVTNQFDATGSFNCSISNNPSVSPQFFQLQVP
jgi:autotransporter-associated beta strand protein